MMPVSVNFSDSRVKPTPIGLLHVPQKSIQINNLNIPDDKHDRLKKTARLTVLLVVFFPSQMTDVETLIFDHNYITNLRERYFEMSNSSLFSQRCRCLFCARLYVELLLSYDVKESISSEI